MESSEPSERDDEFGDFAIDTESDMEASKESLDDYDSHLDPENATDTSGSAESGRVEPRNDGGK